jgi:predicted TIM-barrel fold metal-dependent hydrolase
MLKSDQVTRRLDPDGSKFIAMMDNAGVDMAVTCPVDYAYILGEAGRHIEDINAQYPPLVAKYPGRLVYMCGVDPRRPNAVDLFKKALTEWGARGLKLHPTTGFLPNDEVCHPLYRLALEYDVPVLFHTGPSWMKARFAHPFYIDDLAAELPDLKIWLGHTSGEWWRDALTVLRTKRNCYAELAGWQNRAANNPEQFVRDMGELRNACGAERILYGTDWPAPQGDLGLFVKAIRDLPVTGRQYGIDFTAEETEAILGGNTARQLGLS